MQIIQLIIPKVDHNSISDLGVSSEIAMAAVRSACMNVWINLNDVDSNQYRKKLISKTEKLIEDSKEIHNSNIDFIKNVIYD